MLQNPFSFECGIRRSEFGISFIIYVAATGIVGAIGQSVGGAAIIGLAYIPII